MESIDEIREVSAPTLRKGGAEKAIVFGSYARGDADSHSDPDLIIVAETEASFFDPHKAFSAVYDAWGRGLDLLIYTPHEMQQMLSEGRAFIELALEQGVVIYEE
jgi:predicted nucleotidyltransferase